MKDADQNDSDRRASGTPSHEPQPDSEAKR